MICRGSIHRAPNCRTSVPHFHEGRSVCKKKDFCGSLPSRKRKNGKRWSIKLEKEKNQKIFESLPFREKNIILALIIILLLTLLLGFMTYKEVQRERYYLWELARSEGLNIAFSLQTLGPKFILNENILKEILLLLKKEEVSYIDICNDKGLILISTEEERGKSTIQIFNPGKIHFVNTQDKNVI